MIEPDFFPSINTAIWRSITFQKSSVDELYVVTENNPVNIFFSILTFCSVLRLE
jgi:hypothetical protein